MFIYKDLDSILNVLNNDTASTNLVSAEIKELISIYETKKCTADVSKRQNPLIVFEGLDGSGKSTIIKIINRSMKSGRIVSTPPDCIKHLRPYFDDKPVELRLAFYSLGNYIAAEEIKEMLDESTVLLDRFWHSTCAFALAQESGKASNLPPTESDIYNWPDDLLKPDVVIFLSVPENMRIQRLSRRPNFTPEEDRLKNDDDYRSASITALLRMKNPGVTKILSIKSPKRTAELTRNQLISLGLEMN